MLKGLRRYVWDRRRGLASTAGLIGGFYIFVQYLFARLEEMRDKVMQDRIARENLRKRFQQNQEDCTYHVLALLPTLGNAILEEMDVERISLALQQSRGTVPVVTNASSQGQPNPPQLPSHSTFNSIALSESLLSEATSGSSAESSSSSNLTGPTDAPPSNSRRDSAVSGITPQINYPEPSFDTSGLGSSSADWVREFRAQQVNSSPTSSAEARLSDSVSGTSLSLITDESYGDQSGVMVDSAISGASVSEDEGAEPQSPIPPTVSTKTKVELWKEMKILAFTRALTILYSLTLLSLLTHIQLNLIGTRKYVESVRQMARQSDANDSGASIGSLFWSAPGFDFWNREQSDESEEGEEDRMTEELERKYLTMSWWLLNVGWKDVAERVREAVEVVFQSVSLKSNLGPRDVERLVSDVRRRVEYDVSESNQRINFLMTLLPSNEKDQEFVLLQGGLASHDAHIDPPLRTLLRETSEFVSSADFGIVFGLCLDRGTATLVDGLRENVFGMGLGVEKIESDDEVPKVRFASLLPAVSRWSHLAVNGIPNELVESLGEMREMTAFSAVLFSSFANKI